MKNGKNIYGDKLAMWHGIWFWFDKYVSIPHVTDAGYIYDLNEQELEQIIDTQTDFKTAVGNLQEQATIETTTRTRLHLSSLAKTTIGLKKLDYKTTAETQFEFVFNRDDENIYLCRLLIFFNENLFNAAIDPKAKKATRLASNVFGIGLLYEKCGDGFGKLTSERVAKLYDEKLGGGVVLKSVP